MDSSASSRREKYCHNGGMASPTTTASACLGVHDGDHGPFRRSPENGLLAGGKVTGVWGPCLWGSNGLVCFFAPLPFELPRRRGHHDRRHGAASEPICGAPKTDNGIVGSVGASPRSASRSFSAGMQSRAAVLERETVLGLEQVEADHA
jgi:hypothetical protein